jgi:hypothetical protein
VTKLLFLLVCGLLVLEGLAEHSWCLDGECAGLGRELTSLWKRELVLVFRDSIVRIGIDFW